MASDTISILLPNERASDALAARIAPLLKPGDTLLLEGPIGAGKTHFARALINARLLEPEDVPSPTFTLVQTYQADGVEIWHCDLYRLTDPDEILELGLEGAFDTAICLIEWPDRLGADLPEDALTLSFEQGEQPDSRILTAAADTARWSDVLEALRE